MWGGSEYGTFNRSSALANYPRAPLALYGLLNPSATKVPTFLTIFFARATPGSMTYVPLSRIWRATQICVAGRPG